MRLRPLFSSGQALARKAIAGALWVALVVDGINLLRAETLPLAAGSGHLASFGSPRSQPKPPTIEPTQADAAPLNFLPVYPSWLMSCAKDVRPGNISNDAGVRNLEDELIARGYLQNELIAKRYIDQLRKRNFAEIERDIAPYLSNQGLRGTLLKMAALMPSEDPTSIKVVGLGASNAQRINISFEYQFSDRAFLVNVATESIDNSASRVIIGFHVYPIPESLECLNKFTLADKSIAQYLMLAWTALVPLFSLSVLRLCVGASDQKRKGLWATFILLGFGQLSVDWGTGQWHFVPLAVRLLSAGVSAPQYDPHGPWALGAFVEVDFGAFPTYGWVISASLPLGAVIFLLRRKVFNAFVPENWDTGVGQAS
jgi:hypothetical protein